jgi:tRNA (guanine26-N2/guanine27-N2)-dimethyltransferase
MSFPFPTEAITEGSADLLIPKLSLYARGESEYIPHLAPVFYNPRMQLNRDIAVLALQVYQKSAGRPLRVTDPLTGCGVRGIRFALEVQGLESVEINDLNPLAADLAKANIDRNHLAGKVKVSNLDGNLFLTMNASPKKRFDVVDLDPFGSPSPFLDSAVRALSNHGLLAVTATDTSPLCGVEPNACIRKYMGKPLRSEYCHEVALRLIANALVFTAAKYDLGPKLLLSYSIGHYFRVYARLERGARRADTAVNSLGYILHCFHCLNRTSTLGLAQELNTRCPRCGSRMQVAGPLWLGPLVDSDFCQKMVTEAAESTVHLERGRKLLTLLAEEAKTAPTYYVIDKVCDRLDTPIPPRETIINELRDRGFTATRTHFAPAALKTNASIEDLESAILQALGH